MGEINKTIGDGIGLDEATLRRIDSLLRVLEDDLQIGLDEETLTVLDGLADKLGQQPGQWEDAFTEIILQLEQSAGTAILFPEDDQEPATPWVCQLLPLSVVLEPVGDRLLAKDVSVRISGYNFTPDNLPAVYLVDDPGNRVIGGPALFAHLTSAYLITVNLQDKDFRDIPVGTYIRLEWTDPAAAYDQLIKAEEKVAYLEVVSEGAHVHEGPGTGYRYLGSAEKGARYEVLGRNGASTWWQIKYGNAKGWIAADQVKRNDVDVEVALDVPVEPPKAAFTYEPESAVAPVTIEFTDASTGEGLDWYWKFGDGGESMHPNPTHLYALSGDGDGHCASCRASGSGTKAVHPMMLCHALLEPRLWPSL